jgi:hypothetical protein
MTKEQKQMLDQVCAQAFAKLDELDEIMYGYGWISLGGPKFRRRHKHGQAPMFMGGADDTPKPRNPTGGIKVKATV